MSETILADKWLTATLETATSGSVWSDVAPDNVTEPYVVFSFVSGSDLVTLGGTRVWSDMTYTVKVVAETETYLDLETVYGLVDAALQAASSPVSGGIVVWCTREQPVRYAEVTGGRTYKHLGGLYRIQVREE